MSKRKVKKHHYISAASLVIIISLAFIIFSIVHTSSINKSNTVYKVNAAEQAVWQQFDGNEQKNGTDNDPLITKSTVTSLKKIWQVPVSSDGSPVYVSGVATSQGIKNLVFITTKNGGITAYDDSNGAQVWSKTTSGNSGTTTSSPALDPNNQFVYSYGKDGKVHKYDVATGKEETSGGWPLVATTIPNVEKGSSALAIGNGYLYVTTSAYPGDAGQYVGHVVAKNLTSSAISVFNSLCTNNKTLISSSCSSRQSGIWARPGVVVDPNTGNIFVSTGNGPYTPPNDLGDSVVELSPDLSKIIDIYTPTNFQQLDDDDADLGSAVVGIIPSLELGIQGGKDNKIRILNLKNLSGKGGPDHTGGELQTISVSCNIFSHPISWNNGGKMWVFVTDMCNNLYAYKLSGNTLTQVYKNSSDGGSSPLLVNGIVFIQSSNAVRAIDPTSGTVLWTGQVGSMHWQSPAVVNGHVFVIDNSNLTAFAVPNNTPTVAFTGPAGSTPGNPLNPVPTNFVCLGSCPTPSTSVIALPSVAPTGTLLVPNPCATTATSASTVEAKRHNHSNGNVSSILQFLIQLITLLIQFLLGGGTGNLPMPRITPCVSPTL